MASPRFPKIPHAGYLASLGVEAERLSTVSFGKEKPAVDEHEKVAWAKNRRDDFVPAP